MKIRCPKCDTEFAGADVNPSANVAFCRSCSEAFALAELIAGDPSNDPDAKINLYEPPRGAWFEDFDDGFEVGASTRSWAALFIVPFMMVWSGFSLGGIYGTQIYKGQFNPGMSLFGIPFVIGSVFLGAVAAMTVCGRIVIRVHNNEGSVFTGVGRLGFRKRFNWKQINCVVEQDSHSSGRITRNLFLDGEEIVKIGNFGNDKRQRYVRAVLKAMIAARGLKSRNHKERILM